MPASDSAAMFSGTSTPSRSQRAALVASRLRRSESTVTPIVPVILRLPRFRSVPGDETPFPLDILLPFGPPGVKALRRS